MNYKAELISKFENDIDSLIKLVKVAPLIYNSMSMKLKKDKRIIENTYIGLVIYGTPGIDFYSVIANKEDKVEIFREVFSDIPCSKDILGILIIDEYCAEKSTKLLDEYKDIVMTNDKLLNNILIICGFIGFLKDMKDDYDFILKMVKINGELLLLASDRLKENVNLIFEAVENNPMVAFALGLSEEDTIYKIAIEKLKMEAHMYTTLPSLDIN